VRVVDPAEDLAVIQLSRDVVAVTIPYGHKTRLPQGSQVEITQELGGSFTVLSDYGLLRIDGKDADAIGRANADPLPVPASVDVPKDAKEMATRVWDQMKTCYDPEIPVNIVELGLVYENKVEPLPAGGYKVDVKFTLTAPGCGMGGILQAEARDKILGIPGVQECAVEVVFDPPWNQGMMSEAARLQLGMM
jgi:probable FeS assembly SUF system protein SufT